MTERRVVAGLVLAAFAAAAALPSAPAAAHHTGPEFCDQEVGIWTQSDRARQGLLTKEHMVQARVLPFPPTATCFDGWATKWWRRTSTNYNVIPNPSTTPADDDNRTEFLNYPGGYSVDGQTDYINSRTTGQLVTSVQESVNLYVTTDGGVRLWFDGNLVIDEWHDHATPTTYHYPTSVLTASKEYPVVVEYYHRTGQQKLQLHWKTSPTGIVMPKSTKINGPSTQHSALHARTNETCTETVAYRKSDGELLIWGYGCGPAFYEADDPDDEIISLGVYSKDWVTLFQRWNGANNPSTWSHWVHNWDTGQWIYIGSTGPRPEEMQGWLESSGYNVGSTRQAIFENYREGTTYVDFTGCPETVDIDDHQAMDPFYGSGYGDARFYPASNAQDTC